MSWWNPASWYSAATSEATGVLSAVRNWTLSVVNSAVNLAENDIDDLGQWATGAIDDIWQQITDGIAQESRDFDAAYNWIDRQIGGVLTAAYDDVARVAGDVEADAVNLFNQAIHDASQWAADVQQLATGLFDRAEHDASQWAADAVHDAQVAESTARRWVDEATTWAGHAISDAVSDLWHDVMVDVVDPFIAIWRICVKAVDWLDWFAEHPFQVLHDAETDVIDWSRHLPDDLAAELAAHDGAEWADAIAAWFGA
jgi:hypothetical protein